MEKENVFMENFAKTEQTETKDRGRYEMNAEKGSTGFGKFKDQNALWNAYVALEAEFTRRSQRLKELERTIASLQEKAEKPNETESEQGELQGSAQVNRADERALSANGINAVEPVLEKADGDGKQTPTVERESTTFTEDAPGKGGSDESGAMVRGSEKAFATDGSRTDGGFVGREIDLPIERNGTKERFVSEDELYRQAAANEGVRLKIIGEYLSSLGRSDAPLMKGGFGTVATPPVKAKTINEAGDLALSFLKK